MHNVADNNFRRTIEQILDHGSSDKGFDVRPRWKDGTPAHTLKAFAVVNRYDLSVEFPIMSLRQIYWKSALEELLWIWQKKSNNVKALNTRIWDPWADENGSIGKAYGFQLCIKHRYPEGKFDQVDKVLYDLKHNPQSRRIMTNIYNHSDLHEMALAPCAYSMTFNVADGKLNGLLNQRSQDMLTANGWNVVQYAFLLTMMAHVSGFQVGELVHVIADAHIYDRHIPLAKELLEKQSFTAPTLVFDKNIKNFYDFRVDSFQLEDYEYNDFTHRIEVAI